jgi:F-type H+-transporting ATPase subunit delta
MKSTRRTKRAARQLFRLCLVNGAVDEGRVRMVAQQLAQSSRRGALGILTSLQRLVKLDRDRHAAVVESAAPLPHELRDKVQAGLARAYGPGLATSFEHKPELIGGMRIKVGSDVYDGSVKARLAALEAGL